MGEEEFNLHNEQRTTSWKFLCLFSSHLCKGTEAFLEKKPHICLAGVNVLPVSDGTQRR